MNPTAKLFRIKICGVTSAEDANLVAAAGADAIGFNFFSDSKRYVSSETVQQIAERLPPHVRRVGVFVNADAHDIELIAAECQLDFVQLHGDEPPETLDRLGQLRVIRAYRCRQGLGPLREYLQACTVPPVAVLIDAYDPQTFGGTGKTLPWAQLANASEFIGELPMILAGGLTPHNVAEAIRQARPFGVDTASGVERTRPGHKDAALCRDFVAAAKSAFQA